MKDLTKLGIDAYLNIIWRRRWYFIITAVLVASGASVFVWRMPSLYRSETRVLVETPIVPEDYIRPMFRSTPEDRINTIREQIASRTFLERIVEQFQYGGFRTSPDFVMENAVDSLRKQLGIEKTSDSTFTLSFTATDRQLARDVTQRLADELIRSNTASHMDKTIAADQFLDERLREAVQALSAQEEKIKNFKTAHLGELPEQSNANLNTLTGLYTQLTATENALQQARDQKKSLEIRQQEQKQLNYLTQSIAENSQIKSDKPKESVSAAEAELAAQKSVLAGMQRKYTSNHPDVINLARQIQDFEQKIKESKSNAAGSADSLTPLISREGKENKAVLESESLEFEMASIKNQIDKREKDRLQIQQQIKLYQERLNRAPAMEQEMAGLLRENEILKQQYLNMQSKKFSSQMAANVETDKKNETYKIIDPPNLPIRPFYPNRIQFILMGIGAGFFLGIGAAVGRELMDSTIGSEDEAQAVLNLPVLATIFEIPEKKKPIRRLLKHQEGTAEI
jgi:polysaccharide chain length determinant protein (PEP-CTERM system associated)